MWMMWFLAVIVHPVTCKPWSYIAFKPCLESNAWLRLIGDMMKCGISFQTSFQSKPIHYYLYKIQVKIFWNKIRFKLKLVFVNNSISVMMKKWMKKILLITNITKSHYNFVLNQTLLYPAQQSGVEYKPYFRFKIQCSDSTTQSIVIKIFTKDTPQLTGQGDILWAKSLIYSLPKSMQWCM